MKNIEKYKDEILKYAGYQYSLMCLIYENIMKKNDCTGCCSKCKRETIKWLTSEYKVPLLTDEGINFLKEHIKQSGAIAVYIKITKKVDDYCDYRLEIHLETGLISIPFAKRSNLYEMFKNVEIGQDYLPEELGL